MDGKHIITKHPVNSGSYYFNYKHSFSIVLLALVDANYRFIYIAVGCNGRISDGGVFRNSSLSLPLSQNSLNIPDPQIVDGDDSPLRYIVFADDAFSLKHTS